MGVTVVGGVVEGLNVFDACPTAGSRVLPQRRDSKSKHVFMIPSLFINTRRVRNLMRYVFF